MGRSRKNFLICLTAITFMLLYFINFVRKYDTLFPPGTNSKKLLTVPTHATDVNKFAKLSSQLYWSIPNETENSNKNAEPKWIVGNVTSKINMVIAIPSIARSGEDYIYETMTSLMQQTDTDTILTNKVIFVVFVADTDDVIAKQRAKKLQEMFPKEINNGIIQLISSPKLLFPDWESKLVSAFDDSYDRVKWRSKQNLDMRFLFSYSRKHFNPQYFLMMEDDLAAIPNYLQRIIQFTQESDEWLICNFSKIGGAGKLFHRMSMYEFEQMLNSFWNAKPLDWLLWDYLSVKLCGYGGTESKLCPEKKKRFDKKYKDSLFIHKGKKSSSPE